METPRPRLGILEFTQSVRQGGSRNHRPNILWQSENLLRLPFSAQHVRSLAVSEPVYLLKGRHVLLDRLDVRELLDSTKRPLIRGPT